LACQFTQNKRGFNALIEAGVAQLAEHNVANVVVVGSNPITRSFVILPFSFPSPHSTIRSMTSDSPTADALEIEEEAPKLALTIDVAVKSTCERHITVTISKDDIARYRDKAVAELLPKAEVPGFRIGKAPRKLVENRFKDQVENQIKGSLLMDSMTQVTEENDFSAISEPDFDYDSISVPDEGDMTFEFDLEVRPEFDMPKWEGLDLERPIREYADADVDEQIDKLRGRQAELAPSDGPAAENDFVIVNITFAKDGKQLSNLEEVSVQLRSKLSFRDGVVENFGELLSGAKAGEKKTATVKISDEAENEALRGDEVEIEIELLEVKKSQLPELNQQFLEKLGGFRDVDELKEVVKEELIRQFGYHQNKQIRDQITAELTKEAKWDLPPDLLRRQAGRELERSVMELQAAGFGNEEIQTHENQIRQNSLASTARSLKEHFILERIAENREIEASPEDYEKEILMISLQRHESPRRVRARMEKRGQMDALRNQIVERKVIETITGTANFTDVEFEPESQDTSSLSHTIGGVEDSMIPEAKHGDSEDLRQPADRS
jgi:trigger factor